MLTLKLFDVYGPGDRRKKLLFHLRKAQQDGVALPMVSDQVPINLVYIDDVINAYTQALDLLSDSADVGGHSYAVRGERDHSLGEVVVAFEGATGAKVPVDWDARAPAAREIKTPWRGETLPGWQAQVDLEEGLHRTMTRAEEIQPARH